MNVKRKALMQIMERNENGLSALFPRSGSNAGNVGNSNTGNSNGGTANNANTGSCSDSSYSGVPYTGRGSAYTLGCGGMNGRQLAMVYSPMQCWRMLHSPEEALMKGTLFEELYKPYEEEW